VRVLGDEEREGLGGEVGDEERVFVLAQLQDAAQPPRALLLVLLLLVVLVLLVLMLLLVRRGSPTRVDARVAGI
jgi:hypothetical protein